MEIEVVLPLYQKEGCAFCNCIGIAIAKGLRIEDGLMVDSLFTDELGCKQPIYFFKTKPIHGEKEVYRAIFPDPNGLFPWEVKGVRVVCRPIDYSDPMHKSFKEYKERYFQDGSCLDKNRFEET